MTPSILFLSLGVQAGCGNHNEAVHTSSAQSDAEMGLGILNQCLDNSDCQVTEQDLEGQNGTVLAVQDSNFQATVNCDEQIITLTFRAEDSFTVDNALFGGHGKFAAMPNATKLFQHLQVCNKQLSTPMLATLPPLGEI